MRVVPTQQTTCLLAMQHLWATPRGVPCRTAARSGAALPNESEAGLAAGPATSTAPAQPLTTTSTWRPRSVAAPPTTATLHSNISIITVQRTPPWRCQSTGRVYLAAMPWVLLLLSLTQVVQLAQLVHAMQQQAAASEAASTAALTSMAQQLRSITSQQEQQQQQQAMLLEGLSDRCVVDT